MKASGSPLLAALRRRASSSLDSDVDVVPVSITASGARLSVVVTISTSFARDRPHLTH
jgi:hypothetical protein